jgi:hypothetical protein
MTDDARKTPGNGFELWDVTYSGNLIMDWDTLEDAQAFLRGELEGLSEDEAMAILSRWKLMEVVDGQWTDASFEGEALLKLAREQ